MTSTPLHIIYSPDPDAAPATIAIPGSKSYAARALLCNAYGHYPPRPLDNLPLCADIRHLQRALQAFAEGAERIDVGESGTAFRFMLPLLASAEGRRCILTGSDHLLTRPMLPLVEALRQLGADIGYTPGEPIRVAGRRLEGDRVELQGSKSSQFLSALLLFRPGLEIVTSEPQPSALYVAITRQVIDDWRRADGAPYRIPGDWSSASFFYELAALDPHRAPLRLTGLDLSEHDLQPDKIVASLPFTDTTAEDNALTVRGRATIPEHFDFDAEGSPDLVPALACMLAGRNVEARISGIRNLRLKESDRIEAVAEGLAAFGYHCLATDEAIRIDRCETPRPAGPAGISSYNDHRIAMSFAVLAAALPGLPVAISGAEAVDKSFPEFFDRLESAGFKLWRER